MALRVLDLLIPSERAERVLAALNRDDFPQILEMWAHTISDDRMNIRFLLDAEATEAVTDAISRLCSSPDGYRLMLMPVEATLPRQEEPRPAEVDEHERPEVLIGRVSREELHADLSDSARVTKTFLVLAALSALVAVIGLVRDSVTVLIGAMVIAPFLGPNVALALSVTLADGKLVLRSLHALLVGLLIALAIAVAAGAVLRPPANSAEIVSRTSVAWADIALAVASGAAGGIAYTTAVPTALVGVMVSVALLPPWVTFGMLLGSGQWAAALGALLLTVLNIVCLNLAGVMTFVLQGLSPAKWWEARQARKMTLTALAVWLALLAGLVVLLLFARRV